MHCDLVAINAVWFYILDHAPPPRPKKTAAVTPSTESYIDFADELPKSPPLHHTRTPLPPVPDESSYQEHEHTPHGKPTFLNVER